MKASTSIQFSRDPATIGGSGLPRENADFYPTPASSTEMLLPYLPPPGGGKVWEPAAGNGAIVKILQRAAYSVVASDLYDRGAGYRSGVDFLAVKKLPKHVTCIVTNPPYSKETGTAFVRHALRLFEESESEVGFVAMFVRAEFLFAKNRRDLFVRPDFDGALFVGRPRWFADTTTSPRFEFCWLTWAVGVSNGQHAIRFGSKKPTFALDQTAI